MQGMLDQRTIPDFMAEDGSRLLAQWYLDDGILRQGQPWMKTALQAQPQNPTLLLMAAQYAWQAGDQMGADELARQARETAHQSWTPEQEFILNALQQDR